MNWDTYLNGVLAEHGDDATQTITDYGPDGMTVISTRPYAATQPDPGLVQSRQLAVSMAVDHSAIITTALTQLAADSAAATARVTAITSALSAIAVQLAQVQGFAFSSTVDPTLAGQLNTALVPTVASILTRLQQVAQLLADLTTWRANIDQSLAWIGRYVTKQTGGT